MCIYIVIYIYMPLRSLHVSCSSLRGEWTQVGKGGTNEQSHIIISYFLIWKIFVPGLLRKSWLTTCNCLTRKKESMLSSIRENHSGKVKTYLVLINHDWYLHLCLHAVMWKLNEYSVICILICIYMLVTSGAVSYTHLRAHETG